MDARTIMTNYLNKIQVASPCPASWESMTGDDISRHCDSCNLPVYNLSEMTKQEAEDFLARSIPTGRVCAKFYRRTDGTILTDDCPRGLRILRNTATSISRKVAATIVLLISSFPSNAQSNKEQPQIPQPQKSDTSVPYPFIKPSIPRPYQEHSGEIMGDIDAQPRLKEINWGVYMADLQRRIRRAWFPPKKGEKEIIKVRFKLHKDGSVTDIIFEERSPSEPTNEAALKAIKENSFRPLPVPAEAISIHFTFDSNLFQPNNHNLEYEELK